MMRLLTLILSLLISSTLSVSAKISKEDYIKIFTNYNITERIKIQPVINECINRFGKENLKIIKTDKGDVLDHKNEKAFYYVRVLENPVCRWSTWDSIREGVEPRSDIPATIQERAWTSPIWFEPTKS